MLALPDKQVIADYDLRKERYKLPEVADKKKINSFTQAEQSQYNCFANHGRWGIRWKTKYIPNAV